MAEPLQQPDDESKKESEENEHQPQEPEPQKENALDSEKLEEAQESVEPQTQEDIPEKLPEAIPTSEPLQEKETDKKEPETSPPEKPKDVSIEATEPQGTKQEDDDNKPISYNYEELYSKPVLTSSMQQDTLQFLHCFGYECQKRSNLLALDEDTLLYAAGNLIVLLTLSTGKHTYLRSLGGGGIGAITVHPTRNYFAVGEKGHEPVIAIFQYPSLVLHRLLRGGTEQQYSHMDFNPDGTLLASIGGNPDYMLTVWDWEKENIVLRSKAFSQDIYRVSFSPELPGQLTTSGTGHIRFWKMATTFTGLKLQGYLGKFGRTELTDIAAYVELPDGKVLSGTEWGNMLLWDGGFIKVELAKKGKKFCHNGTIESLYLDEGELISAGVDGYIRIWDFETIDNADITEENTIYEIEPLTEIKVGSDVSIKSLTRSTNPDTPTIWYAQDAKGSIWKTDIVVSHTRKPPERLVRYHSGEIKSVDVSPVTHHAASIAEDGSVRVYDFESGKVLCHTKYPYNGSSLLWAPLSVDASGLTLITGYADGVLRVLKINKSSLTSSSTTPDQLSLLAVCKPHTQAITALAVDKEGTLLATGSADNTVFFLNIKDGFTPVGFVNIPASVSFMVWSQPNQGPLKLLVCCHEGSMVEISAPLNEDFDTSQSYHLQSLNVVSRKFTSIKDRLRREEVEAKLAAEKERKRKEREAQREAAKAKRREELGEDYESEEEEELVEEEEEEEEQEEGGNEEEEEEEKPAGPSPIHTAFYQYSDKNKFWVSMGGYDAGYLYCCSLEGADNSNAPYEAPQSVPVPPLNGKDIPLHSMIFSHSGYYLLTGTDNGCVRIHRLNAPYSLQSLEQHWTLTMHDNQYGYISSLAVSYDDQYLITGGGDSNVFIYKANLPTTTKITRPITSGKQELSKPDAGRLQDIDDPSHYSIEDAKQKAEHDRKMKAAEAKKQKVLQEIKLLRRTYTQLQQRSQHLPPHLRLNREEFVMDPSMSQQLQQQLSDKLELVRKEMAWEAEKHNVALKKLQQKYKDIVECDRIVVWTVKGDHCVSSLRSPLPSPQYLALLETILSSELTTTPWTGTGERVTLKRKSHFFRRTDEIEEDEEDSNKGQKELNKSEIRRLKKEKRKKEWEELLRVKPGDDYEDPEEVAAIEKATQQMGDYKLKTSSDYVVSEEQRMSTAKKQRELIICRNTIFQAKRQYNQKLLSLRDNKLQMVDKIADLVKQLQDIHTHLPPALCKPIPPIPVIKPEEVPEKELEYTKESLLAFKKELQARQEAERLAQTGEEGFGGFGGFGGGGGGGGDEEQPKDEKSPSSGPSTASIEETDTVTIHDELERATYLNDTERLVAQEEEIRLLYEQDNILADIEELVSEFDAAVLHLCHEKALTDVTIKTMELKHLTQFEELELLKEFEKRETNFTSKYRAKKKERADIELKIEEVDWGVKEKERLVTHLQEQEKTLDHSFMEAVGENNKFKEFLVKVYRKKVKRAKQKEEKDVDDNEKDEDDDDDETDSEDWSSSEDESDEERFDDSVCPPGCDPTIFDKAVQMREQRLDIEESLVEEKKILDSMKKERDSLLKKAKTMEAHVKTAMQELQAFQLKKQQRLNELDAVVVLKLHQILHYQTGGEPPNSVSQCLVFPASARVHLAHRIGELVLEKQQEKKRYRDLRQRHVRLIRERKTMEQKVAELDEKANEMMLLKFGRVVNLDALEGLTTNKLVGELEETLKEMDKKYDKSKRRIETKINMAKQELLNEVQHNTNKLDDLHEFTNHRHQLEDDLNIRQKTMGMDISSGSVFDPEEKARLLDIVKIQSREIEALQEEIKILSHKGGHILPPTQPPHALSQT